MEPRNSLDEGGLAEGRIRIHNLGVVTSCKIAACTTDAVAYHNPSNRVL
jgi:hypothetical protein